MTQHLRHHFFGGIFSERGTRSRLIFAHRKERLQFHVPSLFIIGVKCPKYWVMVTFCQALAGNATKFQTFGNHFGRRCRRSFLPVNLHVSRRKWSPSTLLATGKNNPPDMSNTLNIHLALIFSCFQNRSSYLVELLTADLLGTPAQPVPTTRTLKISRGKIYFEIQRV